MYFIKEHVFVWCVTPISTLDGRSTLNRLSCITNQYYLMVKMYLLYFRKVWKFYYNSYWNLRLQKISVDRGWIPDLSPTYYGDNKWSMGLPKMGSGTKKMRLQKVNANSINSFYIVISEISAPNELNRRNERL